MMGIYLNDVKNVINKNKPPIIINLLVVTFSEAGLH